LKIYLAHPLDLIQYGFELQRKIEEIGYKVVNPFSEEWKRMPASGKIGLETALRGVEEDIECVGAADVVVAITHGKVTSIGTIMEIRAAAVEYHKPVYILAPPELRYHIFLMTHGQVFLEENFLLQCLELYKKVLGKTVKIAICGKMGTGKSTVADFIVKTFSFHRASFAAKLKEIARDLYGMQKKDRELLQRLGDATRQIDPACWARYLLRNIKHYPRVVIDDLRFVNETKLVREAGFKIVKLVCDEKVRLSRCVTGMTPETMQHPSETEVDLLAYDYLIDTSRSEEDSYKQTFKILRNEVEL